MAKTIELCKGHSFPTSHFVKRRCSKLLHVKIFRYTLVFKYYTSWTAGTRCAETTI